MKNINFKTNLGDCRISKVKEVHNNYDNDVITCNNEMHNNYDDNVIICNNEIMFIIYQSGDTEGGKGHQKEESWCLVNFR